MRRCEAAVAAALLLLAGCGVQGPSGSEGAGGTVAPDAPSYPQGPYGTEIGDVIADLAFVDRTGAEVRLGRYYQADAPALVLFITAGWCSACVESTFVLRDGLAEQQPGRAQVLGVLIEDAAMGTAEPADAGAFMDTLSDAFEFVADGDRVTLDYFVNPALPQLQLIDTRTMTIELKTTGAEQQMIDAVGAL